MLAGLTGLSCAGKNYVARIFQRNGFAVLDADEVAHDALLEAKDALLARWGTEIFNADGMINRAALGKKVFGKRDELAALESITYPLINKKTFDWLSGHEGEACIFNAPLLHKSAVFDKLDCIIIVSAPFLIRLFRALLRDKRSFSDIIGRFKSQKNFTVQYLRKNTDTYIIENGWIAMLFPKKLKKKVAELCKKLFSYKKAKR
jgi:dephospho-CoA kinase